MIKTRNDLDNFLKRNGITQEAITYAKSITPIYANKNKDYYYDYKYETNEIKKVNIDDIYTPTRKVNDNYSWYDNLYFTLTDHSYKYGINLEKKRFYNLLSILSSMNITEFVCLIENADGGKNLDYIHRFSKYVDENNNEYYYQEQFHAHRLILAKVIGARYVTSDCIKTYRFNKFKYIVLSKLLKQQERLIETIKRSKIFEINIDDKDMYIQFNSEIIPKKQRDLIKIVGDFDDLLKKPYANEFKKYVYKYERKIDEIYQYEIAILTIEKIIDTEYNHYQILPKFLLQKILKANSEINIEEICTKPTKLIKTIKCMQLLKQK